MDVLAIADQYYDAWIHHAGDMTDVPLAADLTFTGPVASFRTADGYRAMARKAGAAVRGFRVRHRFVTGQTVCSIIDWEMDPLPGTLTAAELLHIRDGQIVRAELIYDAEDLRRATVRTSDLLRLLRRSYDATAELIEQITTQGWASPGPCNGWTVRQTADHLTGGLLLIAQVAEGTPLDPAEADAQRQADTDHLGTDPATAFRAVAERSLAAFSEPGALERQFPFLAGPAHGTELASISLVESLVHGWDIAQGAKLDHPADEDIIDAVWAYARQGVGDAQRRAGMFAEPVLISPTADTFVALLAHLGRRIEDNAAEAVTRLRT
ncbi:MULTISPECIES: TIGR03086 family metal-binding protein [Actinomadura]|uniref:TIGR03086 family metal-binding protein n=1 Tax=Actinomadura TaxID=1988 RepID=UPI0003AD7153|nr:TIGR03086 family metal-binding protein [Actinomadura madurae]